MWLNVLTKKTEKMDNKKDNTPMTIESFLQAIKEATEKTTAEVKEMAEKTTAEVKEMFAASRAEAEQRSAEFDMKLEKSREEFKQEMKESRADFDQRMKKLDELMGGVSSNQGLFCEEYFINSFQRSDKLFFGEQFDRLITNYNFHNQRTHKKGEFDIILVNGTSVAIVETKFKARKNDIQKLINMVPVFREEFPNYQSHRIYLGMAAMTFEKGVDKHCIAEGIAVFKQVGDTVVVTDEHLKAF